MQLHRFGKHPIHLAVVLLLASYAQAQDLSINSMTLDTETGKSLGNISRRGEMKSFFQVQKEMVFNTLSHLGVKLEDLPPKLRQEIEKPQTTNSEAFAAFSKAVDKADKGQFSQAAQLFKQAVKIDPGFGLAKGMARLMPAFDLAPGDGKKAVADMKQNVKDEGKKQGDKLADNLDKKEKNLKEKSEGKEKLAKLADGKDDEKEEDKEEKQSGIKKKLDQLGLSDEGDNKGFKPGEGEEAGLPRIDTGLLGGSGGGFLDPLTLAQQLGQGEVIIPVIPIPPVTTTERTDMLNQANNDKQRKELTKSTSGIYGGIIAGQFVSGSTALTLPSESAPTVLSMDLAKGSGDPERIEFHLDSEGGGSFTSEMFWGQSGSFLGQYSKKGADTYVSKVFDSSVGVDKPILVTVNGTPTPTSKLPSSGVQTVQLSGLLTDSQKPQGYDFFHFGALVDWTNNKVFSPVMKSENGDGVLVIGAVNRPTASLDTQAWDKNYSDGTDMFGYGTTQGMNLQLYGSEAPVQGAGLFTFEERDLSKQVVGNADHGIVLASDFSAAASASTTPAEGETWTGFSSGIIHSGWSGNFQVAQGKSRFTFSPATATVTGGIYTSEDVAFLTTTTSNPNAFFGKDAFGAKKDNALGLPAYYSTQGDFSGAGWSDLQYTSMGYWTQEYASVGISIDSYLDTSTWVAGQATPTSALDSLHLQTGSADYAGKVLGAQHELDLSENSRVSLVTGDFNMTVDFGVRTLSGSLTNLRRDGDASLWLDRADFGASFEGNGYTALISGQGVSDASLLNGAFYGPNAEETGGAWTIYKNANDWAGGVYAAKRGDILAPIPSVAGIYGGLIAGQFVSGLSALALPGESAPTAFSMDLAKGSGDPEHIEFQLDGEGSGSFSADTFWGHPGSFSGGISNDGDNDFIAIVSGNGTGMDKPDFVIAVNGTPTPINKLPTSGVQTFEVDGIVTDSMVPDGYSSFAFGAHIDWHNNKVFSPAVRSDNSDGVMMIGTVNRAAGSLDVQAWEKNFSGGADVFSYGISQGMNLKLYGSNEPVLGAGLFTIQERDLSHQPVGPADSGMALAGIFNAAPSAAYTPAEGEAWTGFSSGIRSYHNSSGFSPELGKSRFTFSPASATVTGGIYTDADQTLFATTVSDPNAFFGKDAFGAKTDNALGLPSYYSTQGDFSGAGWTDLLYTSMGYWTHDLSGEGILSYLDTSTWVAGQASPTAALDALHLQSGSADYAGKILGAQQALDQGESARMNLITGSFNMMVDFGERALSGSLTDLRRDWDDSLWLDRADFSASFQGNGYSATISGQGVNSEVSMLSGAFYGPNAEEAGGAWQIIRSSSDWAAGVFSAKRGGVHTPLPAVWAGTINGQFEVGSAEVRTGSPPEDLILTLQRDGHGNGQIKYSSWQGSTNYFQYLGSTLWDTPGEAYQSGSTQAYGLDAYFANFYQSPGYPNTTNADSINITAFGGNRTTQAQLPQAGQYAYSMTVLSHNSSGDQSSYGTMAVDLATDKVFMPVRIDPNAASSALLLGTLDGANAMVNAQVWAKNAWPSYGADPNLAWSHIGNLDMALYGSSVNNQANTGGRVLGGLFTGTDFDFSGVQSVAGQGVASGYSWGGGAYASHYSPSDGDQWAGFAANLLLDPELGRFSTSYGGADFVFTPSQGQVTANLSDNSLEAGFFNTADDPNAFLATNGFGGLRAGSNNQAPFYYSTRSRDTDWENLPWDVRYRYFDNLEYHYVGMWTADNNAYSSILPASSWVAGAITQDVDLPITGYVRYAGYVSGVTVTADRSQYDYISGLFGMTADFGTRAFNGAIENLTSYRNGQYAESGFDFQGVLEANGGSIFSSSAAQGRDPNGLLAYAGINGMFYGLSDAAAREVGGRWWLYLNSGEQVSGIFSGRDGSKLDWSSGVLSDMGEKGLFAVSHPLAANVNYYTNGDNTEHVSASFLLPGALGNFTTGDVSHTTPVANRTYLQWTMTQSDDSYADAYFSSYPYSFVDFKTSNSYVQYSPDKDFFRFFLVDVTGEKGVEGYFGTRTDSGYMPSSGITTYGFHQSAIEKGLGNSSDVTGQDGIFPGQLYVNWETGAVFGYNVDPAVVGGGKGMFLGTLNRNSGKLEGTYQVRTNRLWADDPEQSARFMEDKAGVSVELFGNNGTPSGLGAVFATALQGEDLAQAAYSGQALISGLVNKTVAAPVNSPSEGEVWNGFAVGFLADRTSGAVAAYGSTNEQGVAITFHADSGHVDGQIEVWQDMATGFSSDPIGLYITGAGSPPTEAEHQAGASLDSASAYVSTKAFGMVQKSPSPGNGAASTTEFIAAAPEAFDEQEAARYEYTTWGAWGADVGYKDNTIAPNSMWVAGKLTQVPDMPVSGTANYSGMVAGQVMGTQQGYVQGQLNMGVDFTQRSVNGTMNNLNFNNNPSTPWVAQANLNGGWNAGTVQYNTSISGTAISSGQAAGAFFGPQAVETGGNWAIQKSDGSLGAGIFVGKRGNITP